MPFIFFSFRGVYIIRNSEDNTKVMFSIFPSYSMRLMSIIIVMNKNLIVLTVKAAIELGYIEYSANLRDSMKCFMVWDTVLGYSPYWTDNKKNALDFVNR